MSDDLHNYLLDVSFRDSELLARLREETDKHPLARMQISREQGQFMALLLGLMSAKNIIEIGVFTGYSTLVMAQALPPDGRIIACDIDEETTKVARRYWRDAEVDHKIDLHVAPALQTLEELVGQNRQGEFDFAFIDADKENYSNYFEKILQLLRPGGLIAIDNTLWGGNVIDETADDSETVAIRGFNLRLLSDQRIELSLVPIGDGLTLALKKR